VVRAEDATQSLADSQSASQLCTCDASQYDEEALGPLTRHLGRDLPESFDWRDQNGFSYIGPIRHQKHCGCGYAFAAVAAAEVAYNRSKNLTGADAVDFSEADLAWRLAGLEAYKPYFHGCDGSDLDYHELDAVVEQGMVYESLLPYTGEEPESRDFCEGARITPVVSWHRIPCGDIQAIKTAIMVYGAVVAAVNAEDGFVDYNGGIYEDEATECDAEPCYYATTNHLVVLLGWDDNGDPGEDGYWILRNSWGENWGEEGYMRIKYLSARVACAAAYLEPKTINLESTIHLLLTTSGWKGAMQSVDSWQTP
jgi:C1A family cysteine protease